MFRWENEAHWEQAVAGLMRALDAADATGNMQAFADAMGCRFMYAIVPQKRIEGDHLAVVAAPEPEGASAQKLWSSEHSL